MQNSIWLPCFISPAVLCHPLLDVELYLASLFHIISSPLSSIAGCRTVFGFLVSYHQQSSVIRCQMWNCIWLPCFISSAVLCHPLLDVELYLASLFHIISSPLSSIAGCITLFGFLVSYHQQSSVIRCWMQNSIWLPCFISSAVLCHPLLDVELYLASLFHIISSPLSSIAGCRTLFGFLVSYHQQSSVIHCWMQNSIWLPCFISSAVLCHPLLDVELYLASLFHIISSPLSSVAGCRTLFGFLVSYHQQSSVIHCWMQNSIWLPCFISSAVLCHPLLDVELYLASLFHIISSPLSSVARCGTLFGFLVSYHQQSSVIRLLDVELYLASLFHIISSPLSSIAGCRTLFGFLVSYHQQSSVIHCWMQNSIWLPCFISSAVLCHPLLDVELYLASLFHIISSPLSSVAGCRTVFGFLVSYHQQSSVIHCWMQNSIWLPCFISSAVLCHPLLDVELYLASLFHIISSPLSSVARCRTVFGFLVSYHQQSSVIRCQMQNCIWLPCFISSAVLCHPLLDVELYLASLFHIISSPLSSTAGCRTLFGFLVSYHQQSSVIRCWMQNSIWLPCFISSAVLCHPLLDVELYLASLFHIISSPLSSVAGCRTVFGFLVSYHQQSSVIHCWMQNSIWLPCFISSAVLCHPLLDVELYLASLFHIISSPLSSIAGCRTLFGFLVSYHQQSSVIHCLMQNSSWLPCFISSAVLCHPLLDVELYLASLFHIISSPLSSVAGCGTLFGFLVSYHQQSSVIRCWMQNSIWLPGFISSAVLCHPLLNAELYLASLFHIISSPLSSVAECRTVFGFLVSYHQQSSVIHCWMQNSIWLPCFISSAVLCHPLLDVELCSASLFHIISSPLSSAAGCRTLFGFLVSYHQQSSFIHFWMLNSIWLPCFISSAVLCHPLLDVELYLASLFHIISSPLSSVARCGTLFGFLVSYHQQSSVIHCWMQNSIWLPCFISSAVLCHPLLDVELYLASLFHIISSPLSSTAGCRTLFGFLVSYHQQSSVIHCWMQNSIWLPCFISSAVLCHPLLDVELYLASLFHIISSPLSSVAGCRTVFGFLVSYHQQSSVIHCWMQNSIWLPCFISSAVLCHPLLDVNSIWLPCFISSAVLCHPLLDVELYLASLFHITSSPLSSIAGCRTLFGFLVSYHQQSSVIRCWMQNCIWLPCFISSAVLCHPLLDVELYLASLFHIISSPLSSIAGCRTLFGFLVSYHQQSSVIRCWMYNSIWLPCFISSAVLCHPLLDVELYLASWFHIISSPLSSVAECKTVFGVLVSYHQQSSVIRC